MYVYWNREPNFDSEVQRPSIKNNNYSVSGFNLTESQFPRVLVFGFWWISPPIGNKFSQLPIGMKTIPQIFDVSVPLRIDFLFSFQFLCLLYVMEIRFSSDDLFWFNLNLFWYSSFGTCGTFQKTKLNVNFDTHWPKHNYLPTQDEISQLFINTTTILEYFR